jgi:hypothetical protein
MNNYEKYQKEYLKTYFHSENGKQHLKDAQKRYRRTEAGIKQNTENWMRWYNKKKELNNEMRRLGSIEIF